MHPNLKQGYDLVLIARNSFGPEMTLAELAGQLDRLVRRARLLADPSDDEAHDTLPTDTGVER
jgi:RNase P protein component